jgi:hypothetical protein
MKLNAWIRLISLGSLFVSLSGYADVWDKWGSHREEYKENVGVEDYEWEEGKVQLPDYPEDADLIEFAGPAAFKQYQYFIDGKNLIVGEDGVVRYSIIIRSRQGTDNVMHEGLRCTSGEYKNYAYGSVSKTGKKVFIARKKPQWKPVKSQGATGYSSGLKQHYFCSHEGFPLTRQEIIQNLKYGKGNTDGWYY